MMSENKTLRIRLNRCTFLQISEVYHTAGHLHECGRVDPEHVMILEAFGEEFVAALNQHPDCTPADLLQVMLSTREPGLAIEVDQDTTLRLLVVCKALLVEEPVDAGGPFSNLLHLSQEWLQENITNWFSEDLMD